MSNNRKLVIIRINSSSWKYKLISKYVLHKTSQFFINKEEWIYLFTTIALFHVEFEKE